MKPPPQFSFITKKHAIVIDGVSYDCPRNVARLCEFLMSRKGEYLQAPRIAAHLNVSVRSIRDYATEVRTIIDQYGFQIQSKKGWGHLGYRFIEKEQSKTERCRDNLGHFTERKENASDQNICSFEAPTRLQHKVFFKGWRSFQRQVAGQRKPRE